MPFVREWIAIGAVMAGLSVAFGAFGAHALTGIVAPELLTTYETGARYQMYHAIGILVVGVVAAQYPGSYAPWAGWAFVVGTVLFSGSLYALALTGIRLFGAVAPVGGVAFLTGWGLLAWTTWRG